MPSVMIYIRQADYDKWLAIKDKPEWIHNALQSSSKVEQVPVKDEVVGSTPTSAASGLSSNGRTFGFGPDNLGSSPSKPARNTSAYCKNGHPIPDGRDKCLGKGCKYS